MTTATIDPYAPARVYSPVRFLHRLNPLSKVIAPLPAMVYLIFARDLLSPLAFLLLALALLAVGAHVSWRMALTLIVGLPLAVLVLGLSFGLWTDSSLADQSALLFQVGDYRFFTGSFVLGLTTSLRLVALLTLTLLSGLTTTGPDLVR